MAEIILPPEENEETPQEPELNIDKPTENSKVITIEFEAKKTAQVSTKDTNQQLYTTDTDAWFEFKETSLEGANGTYSAVFRNRHDGSIFQRTGDVVNGVAYYKIPEQEIRHAGKWRGQLVYTLENGDTTAREFGYDVKGHILDGKDVREIVVEDFETLMSQLNSMKDNAELELADLVNAAERNELERQQFYESLVEDINDLQENYQELLDTGVLQTNINEKLEELEEEYAPKLTEVTAQLAKTEREVATELAQTKYLATRPRGLEDLKPEVLAAIEGGEGTSFDLLSKPQERSVTPISTTFIDVSSNLYNSATTKIQTQLDNNGNEIPSTTGNALGDYIKVKPNTTYSVSSPIHTVAYYDENIEHRIRINPTENKFTTPDYVEWVRLIMYNESAHNVQMNEGEQLLPYENYYNILSDEITVQNGSLSEQKIDIENLSFLEGSENLYNRKTSESNKQIDSNGNLLVSTTDNALSDYIKVEPNTTYSISSGAHTIVLFDDKKNFRTRIGVSNNKFTTTAYTEYIRIIMYNGSINNLMLNKGDTLLPYEDYFKWFDEQKLVKKKDYHYYVPENITGFYKAPVKEYKKTGDSHRIYQRFRNVSQRTPKLYNEQTFRE